MPNEKDISKMKELIKKAIKKLKKEDEKLFGIIEETETLPLCVRKAYEVCINHRFAVYIEKFIKKYFPDGYNVDIEFNRNFKSKEDIEKQIIIDGNIRNVRPDIIVHKRSQELDESTNLLVIEAKIERNSEYDKEKIKELLKNDDFNYMFGLIIRYKYLDEAVLYYLEDKKIKDTTLYDKQ